MKKFLNLFKGKNNKPKPESPQEIPSEAVQESRIPIKIGTPQMPVSKTFNLVELADYGIDFRIIQNVEKEWMYCLEFYTSVDDYAPTILNIPEEVVEGLGKINRIENIDCILVYGRDFFTQWEYAAESAIDAVELLGFVVEDSKHEFDVLYWDAKLQEHIVKNAYYDGLDFKLLE